MKTALTILALTLANLAYAEVQVMNEISFTDENAAPKKVQDECGLQTDIPKYLSKFAKKDVVLVKELSNQGKRLELQISHAYAPGGGAWSGAKYVEVRGQLYDGDTQIGSFTGSRYSTGGMFGGFKGTCSIVGRCGKAIAKDISDWLKNPSENALLGDSK